MENIIEKIEKEKNEYLDKIKAFETQTKEDKIIMNDMSKRNKILEREKIEYEKKVKDFQDKLKDNEQKLNETKIELNKLQKEKDNYESKIKEYEYQIDVYKSELSQSKQNNIDVMNQIQNNNKKEYELKLKQYKESLENKYKQMTQTQLESMKSKFNEQIQKREQELKNLYSNNFKNIENKYEQQISQISNSILQNNNNNINRAKCTTVHNGIQCMKCFKNPIKGLRYKCSTCHGYNLCEDCEEKNAETGEHNHLFIKIRNELNNVIFHNNINNNNNNYGINNNNNHANNINRAININQINNNNINYPNFDDDNNDFQLIKFGDENYSFQCINKEQLISEIIEGEDNIVFEIKLKNDGQIQWPSDRAKLIFDETKNFVSQNITLYPQQQNEIKIYKIIFKELRQYPPGNYFASASFEVNGKSYGDKINFVINIKAKNNNRDESLQKVDAFRDMFNLDKNDFSDELLLEKLKENNFNYEGAFGALFG